MRWSFLALEQHWLEAENLSVPGDLFYLKMPEIEHLYANNTDEVKQQLRQLIVQRKAELADHQQLETIPYLVYGDRPPVLSANNIPVVSDSQLLRGIGTSLGVVEGTVRILTDFTNIDHIDKQTIIVVPLH